MYWQVSPGKSGASHGAPPGRPARGLGRREGARMSTRDYGNEEGERERDPLLLLRVGKRGREGNV